MEMFKSLASLKDAQKVVSQIKEGASIEIHGTIQVEMGEVRQELGYYARTYILNGVPNAIDIEDWEINERKLFISGLEIDDYYKFKQGLEDHGLTSIANLIEVDDREVILESFKSNSILKKTYGKNMIIWGLLSMKEKKEKFIQLMEQGVNISKHYLTGFGWVVDGEIIPLDEIKEMELNS